MTLDAPELRVGPNTERRAQIGDDNKDGAVLIADGEAGQVEQGHDNLLDGGAGGIGSHTEPPLLMIDAPESIAQTCASVKMTGDGCVEHVILSI
jgi:hypothetical protein